MVEPPEERQIVVQARSRLQEWTNEARTEAFGELFQGDEPILTAEELQRLDTIDSVLERQGGDGVWGTDQYGIHTGGSGGSDTALGVVCVYHPQITEDTVLRGEDLLDDELEERINAALWRYGERVAALIEDDLQEFVRETRS